MDFAAALTIATTVVNTFIKLEPIAAQAISDFKPFVTGLIEKFTGQPVTEEQRTEIEAKIDDLHNRFQAPIPPESEQ